MMVAHNVGRSLVVVSPDSASMYYTVDTDGAHTLSEHRAAMVNYALNAGVTAPSEGMVETSFVAAVESALAPLVEGSGVSAGYVIESREGALWTWGRFDRLSAAEVAARLAALPLN